MQLILPSEHGRQQDEIRHGFVEGQQVFLIFLQVRGGLSLVGIIDAASGNDIGSFALWAVYSSEVSNTH
jgi:hypothetical protein